MSQTKLKVIGVKQRNGDLLHCFISFRHDDLACKSYLLSVSDEVS